MKTKSIFLHFASIAVFCVFSALCIGSLGSLVNDLLNGTWDISSERMEDGTLTETQIKIDSINQYICTTTGKTDEKGRWHGSTEIRENGTSVEYGEFTAVFVINMVHGKKHGEGLIVYTKSIPPSTGSKIVCFEMDEQVDCDDRNNRTTDTSSYDILINRYPHHWYSLQTLNYEEDFIKSYMDTLENIVGSYDIDTSSFDSYYNDAQEELETTLFDSLTHDNYDLSIFNLLDLVKDGQFRQAVFDRYLLGLNSTYQVVSEFYPEYLRILEDLEFSNEDFEGYCHVFDSLLNSLGPLDTESFAFPDSLDDRIFRTYVGIDSIESDGLIGGIINGRIEIPENIHRQLDSYLNQRGILEDINSTILILSLREFYVHADIIRLCQREAYFRNNEFVDLPVVTTAIKSQESDTEAEIRGFVSNDGGGEVTKRGILWAQHYNPTMDDNQENGGDGIGSFAVTLSDLTPGETYYARSFATNSTGTNFGNCVAFVAQQVTGTDEISSPSPPVKLFPNPANDFIHFTCDKEVSGIMHILILDILGNNVVTKAGNGILEGQLTLDVSSLPEGIYLCQIKYEDGMQAVKKFTVAR